MDPPQQHAGRRRCREYLLALEEERRKIEVFKRELPLCLELVIQTIEGMKSEMDGIGSEETVSDDHDGDPVLEEFIPLKPSLSLSSEEHESAHEAAAASNGKKEEAAETSPATEAKTKRVTPDWLQSMELWSHESQQRSSSSLALNPRKGAFQPFDKEKQRVEVELPASSTMAVDVDSSDKAASTTDTAERHSDDKEMNAKDKGKDKASNRKPRRCWAPELHGRFLQALQQLGGAHVATPKQIRELMKVDGLTNDEVKSHLQKYRLHTARRPNTSTTAQSISAASTAPPAAPQFVVVGGIWLPPPEYANTVYAPVATLPSGLQPRSQQQVQRQSRCRGDSTTESPAVSSSSHATSA